MALVGGCQVGAESVEWGEVLIQKSRGSSYGGDCLTCCCQEVSESCYKMDTTVEENPTLIVGLLAPSRAYTFSAVQRNLVSSSEVWKSIPGCLIVLIILVDKSIEVDAEGDDLSTKVPDLLGSECDGLEESKILAHAPYNLLFLMLIPLHQTHSCFYVLRDWLLAQDMLSGLNSFFDHRWLNAYRQGYDHGVNVFAGKEMMQGMVGCSRRVVVYSDGLSRLSGKLIGRSFGVGVYGFEGEDWDSLNDWKMLCVQDNVSVTAIIMLKEGDTDPSVRIFLPRG